MQPAGLRQHQACGSKADDWGLMVVTYMLVTGELNPAFRAGPFCLPVAEIRAYLPALQTPGIVHISSAGQLPTAGHRQRYCDMSDAWLHAFCDLHSSRSCIVQTSSVGHS